MTEKVAGREPETAQLTEGVTFTLVDESGDKYASDAVMPEYNEEEASNGKVYVKAVYNDVAATKTVAIEALSANYAEEITNMAVTLVDGYSVAKQQYTTDINDTLTTAVIKSITAEQGGETIKIDPADVSVKYVTVTGDSKYETIDGTDITDLTNLVIEVTYEYGGKAPVVGYVAVNLSDAKVEKVTLTAEYTYKNASGNPMVNSPITWSIETSNANGVVNEDAVAAQTWQNGKLSAATNTVSATESYQVMVVVAGIESNIVNVPVGAGYLTVDDIVVETAEGYTPYIDDLFSTDVADYTIKADSWDKVGETTAVPTIKSVKAPSSVALISSKSTDVVVTISYLDASGKELTTTAEVAIEGKPWTDVSKMELTYAGSSEVSEGKLYRGESYTFASFDVTGEVSHGDDSALDVAYYYIGNKNNKMTDNIKLYSSQDPVTFVVEYTDKDTGKVAEIEFALTLADKPKA